MKIRGACYCEQVKFELTAPTEFAGHCHCEDCRRSHSAAFVTWTSVLLAQFSRTGLVNRYESHPGIFWEFCGRCGSHLFYRSDDAPERVYISVGSLLSPLDREPSEHVSFEERVSWFHPGDALPRYRAKSGERMDADHVE